MLKLSVFLFVVILVVTILFILSKPYINPYRLYMVFGKKGSGKTTYMVKLAVRAIRKGKKVYCNIPLSVPGVTFIDPVLLGVKVPEPDSLLLIDEVGMIWDNRDYKNFKNYVRDFFKLQRHYRVTCYLFSQTFDIDLKLRNLTDVMYLLTSPLPFLSVIRRIKRSIVLVQPDGQSEGRIADSLEFVPWFMNLFGMRAFQLTFIPRWSKYFDSFSVSDLPYFSDSD